MVEDTKRSLTKYLEEVVEWRWSEYVATENNEEKYTSDEGAVIALIRAIANRKLPAIKEAIDRLDGRIAAVTEVQYPVFKMLYPYAKTREGLPEGETPEEVLPEPVEEKEEPEELATGSIRATLIKMGEHPRALVTAILTAATEIDQTYSAVERIDTQHGDPKVKSVIAATLHDMARRGNLKAIFEVLDQIDGKIANKIEVKGEDVEMMSYDDVAPANAELNEDGIYEVIMPQLTNHWQIALDPDADNSRRFGDGR